MSSSSVPSATSEWVGWWPNRHNWSRLLQAAQEGVVLTLVSLSPWVYAAVHTGFEFLLYAGVAVLLALWAGRLLLEGQLTWQKCPVALCLAALFLLGAMQLVPLGRSQLALVSPQTARLYDALLPSEAEVLPPAPGAEVPGMLPGSTVSVYPAVTRQALVRILAVFLVFVAVRNNLAEPDRLRRLSGVVLVNGVLLSLFGLIQFFSSRDPHLLYWTYPSIGQVFGPFICRNHFAFYMNLCIGLGLGLLLEEYGRRGQSVARFDRESSWERAGRADSPWGLLQRPLVLFIGGALALMASSVALCLSRGGLIALVGAGMVCVTIRLAQSTRFARLGGVLLLGGLSLGLVAWFGLDLVEARWASMWEGEALQESRLPLWSRAAAVAADFPIWGTGYGTFRHVEPLYRSPTSDLTVNFEYAHNEYLEAVAEGGLPRLALSVLSIIFIFIMGARAVSRRSPGEGQELALGAVFAFTTLVIHSIGEFGLHMPAIAFLAAVIAAFLCGLGRSPERFPSILPPEPDQYSLRLGGLAPLVAAVTLVALGLALCGEGLRVHKVERLQVAAVRLEPLATEDARRQQIRHLEHAERLAPEDAALQVKLAETRFKLLSEQVDRIEGAWQVGEETAAIAVLSAPSLPGSPASMPWTAVSSWASAFAVRQEDARRAALRCSDEHLGPTLYHYRRARDLCPVLPKPHLELAAHVDRLPKADSSSAYLARAKRLAPADAYAWYLCGLQEIADGKPDEAARSWRHSLTLSDQQRESILERGVSRLGPQKLLDDVLPDNPRLLADAAERLYPKPDAADRRQPYYEKALRLLEGQAGPLGANDLYLQGFLQWRLGQPAKALKSYQRALDRQPDRIEWRFQFATLLHEEGRLSEARREVLTILEQRKDHDAARQLLGKVRRDLAEQR